MRVPDTVGVGVKVLEAVLEDVMVAEAVLLGVAVTDLVPDCDPVLV